MPNATVSYTPQPIQVYQQPYPLECSNRLPITPVCLMVSHDSIYPEVRYRTLEACRSDVERFVEAVKFQTECYKKSLQAYIDDAISQVSSRVTCEEIEISNIKNGSGGNFCPAIYVTSIPEILNKDDYSSISPIDPLPLSTVYCDMIKSPNEVEFRNLCIDELTNGFLSEAQNYYDEQMHILYNGGRLYPKREGVKKYVEKVIKKFNCEASGDSICF